MTQEDSRPVGQAAENAPSPDDSSLDADPGVGMVHNHPESARALPLNIVFELLQNSHRRRVLRYLNTVSSPVDLRTLAEAVAAEENEKPVRALTSLERNRIHIRLHHCHLPKLDEAGVIEFDANRGTVKRAELTENVTGYLDRACEAHTD